MKNIEITPKQLILNFLAGLFTGYLLFTLFGQWSEAQKVRNTDWYYYDSYVSTRTELLSAHESTAYESTDIHASDDDIFLNVTDASSIALECAKEAKSLIYDKLDTQALLYWNHFENIQIKECDIVDASYICACYLPEENLIYLNRATMNKLPSDMYLHILTHEFVHALLENGSNVYIGDIGAFHEGFTEYLAQLICPVDQPTYFLNYCIAEVFAKDVGLNKAIELFISGQAEEYINQRLDKKNLIQNLDNPLYLATLFPKSQYANLVIVDAYLHYATIAKVDVEDSINKAMTLIDKSYTDLSVMYYFDDQLKQYSKAVAPYTSRLFSCQQKNTQTFRFAYFL